MKKPQAFKALLTSTWGYPVEKRGKKRERESNQKLHKRDINGNNLGHRDEVHLFVGTLQEKRKMFIYHS